MSIPTLQDWQAIRLSLWVAAWAVLLSVPLAVPVGYWLARSRASFKWAAETLVNLPLVLPPVVTGYLLLALFARNGPIGSFLEGQLGIRVAFTWLGAAVAAAVVSFPLLVRTIRVAFLGVDTRLEGVARTLGAGRLDCFLTISLPLAWRGILAGLVLGFARSLGEFGATIMLAGNIPGETQTIPTAVFAILQTPGGMSRAVGLVACSVALAALTLAASEFLDRRQAKRESA